MNTENIALKVSPSGDHEIAMSRVFNAPRELVFDSLTNLALLKRWFGLFAGWALAICEVDLKVGGAFRLVPPVKIMRKMRVPLRRVCG